MNSYFYILISISWKTEIYEKLKLRNSKHAHKSRIKESKVKKVDRYATVYSKITSILNLFYSYVKILFRKYANLIKMFDFIYFADGIHGSLSFSTQHCSVKSHTEGKLNYAKFLQLRKLDRFAIMKLSIIGYYSFVADVLESISKLFKSS